MKYLFVASMDVDPAFEDVFNEVYDTDHIPHLLKVPGVRSVRRMKGVPFRFAIAGSEKEMPTASPAYTAIFEIDSPDVLSSAAWAHAVEQGRWVTEVRPHTKNRSHFLYRVI
jgi:hypothetical protein